MIFIGITISFQVFIYISYRLNDKKNLNLYNFLENYQSSIKNKYQIDIELISKLETV